MMRVLILAAWALSCFSVVHLASADEAKATAGRLAPTADAVEQPAVLTAVQEDVETLPPGGGLPIPNAVMLRADGTLAASVKAIDPTSGNSVPISDVTVVFIRGGRVVATATPDRRGEFLVSTLRPGVHSIVVHGPAGFMAIGVPIVGFDETALNDGGNRESGKILPVGFLQDEPGELTLNLLVPPSDIAAVDSVMRNGRAGGPGLPPDLGGPPPFGPAGGFGPGGGNFGGGGGGGPGGGGFGDLLGLGGLALGAAALSDDDGVGRRGRGRGRVSPVNPPVRRGPRNR